MLLIIVLGLIANLELVSADCVNRKTTLNNLDWSRFSGPRPWYVLMHKSNPLENIFDCVVGTVRSPEGNRSLVEVNVYDKILKRHWTIRGHVVNWNRTGYCEITPELPIWVGYAYIIPIDYNRYVIVMHCRQGTNEPSYYVAYRSNPPLEATVNDVHRWLQDNNIDTTQLVEWSANHCPQPEKSTAGGTIE